MNVVLNILYDIGKFLLEKLKNFFSWVIKDFKRIIIFVLIVLLGISFLKINNISKDFYNYQQRSIDTLSVYQNKLGEMYQAEATYITTERSLKKENKDLYDELKKLKENPLVIIKSEIEVKRDTVVLISDNTTEINSGNDSIFKADFHLYDDWMKITGNTEFHTGLKTFNTTLTSLSLTSDITTNLIEKDNKLYFISKSSNPYIQINNLEGCVLSFDDSKVIKNYYNKRWALVVGVGPSVTIVNNSIKVYPAVQLTLGYKLLSF